MYTRRDIATVRNDAAVINSVKNMTRKTIKYARKPHNTLNRQTAQQNEIAGERKCCIRKCDSRARYTPPLFNLKLINH